MASASAWSFVTNLMLFVSMRGSAARRARMAVRCESLASSDTQTLIVTSLRTFSVYEKMYEPSAAPMPNR